MPKWSLWLQIRAIHYETYPSHRGCKSALSVTRHIRAIGRYLILLARFRKHFLFLNSLLTYAPLPHHKYNVAFDSCFGHILHVNDCFHPKTFHGSYLNSNSLSKCSVVLISLCGHGLQIRAIRYETYPSHRGAIHYETYPSHRELQIRGSGGISASSGDISEPSGYII